MKMKTYFTFIILVFILLPIKIYADSLPHTHYEDCTETPEFYSANIPAAEEYWSQIQTNLPNGTTPTINKNGSIYPLNFRLWYDKGLVVYGSYRSCNNPTTDWKPKTQPGGPTAPIIDNQGYYYNGTTNSRGEYRYHGFTASGDRFTNIDFPVDAFLGKEANKDWIIYPWSSSLVIPSIARTEYSYSANNLGNPTTQAWINKSIGFTLHVQPNVAYKYLHVQQPPSILLPGQGRMWHMNNGSVWYQSFPIPRLDSSTKMPAKTSDLEVTLTVNNDASDFNFIDHNEKTDDEIITVHATVTATLLDDTYYNDPVEKVNHYTRDDIDKWILTLNGESKTVTRWSENTGRADFEIPLKKSQIKGLREHKFYLSAKGQALFLDNSKSPEKAANSQVQFIIDNEPVPPTPSPTVTPDPFVPPIDFQPQPVVPEYAFDIVKFPASDNTDMSQVDAREVYIDGAKVDDNTFFSGNYVFGEGSEGLKQVAINYTSIDGQKAQFIKWVLVYNTKPRVQFKLDGTFKQNRKLTVTNTSLAANDQRVLDTYPIIYYDWQYHTISGDGSSLKIRGTSTDLYKELMYKKPGTYRITLKATNALGRTSDPYVLQFVIAPDIAPAIEICLDNSVLGRNETISAYHYSASSTDGDTITTNTIELWYDSNNDGTYDQLLNTYDGKNGFPAYVPLKLGKYKYVNKVSEDFGQDTLPEFITPEDKVCSTQEVEFFVDNYIPMTDLYIDIPIVRPQIDVFIMDDANLDGTKNSYIQSNRMNSNNFLRSRNILPQVNVWDMHTYQYSQPANTTVHSGSSYPPSTTSYSSGGYSGTLSRTSVSDNGYNHDFGSYQTVTQSQTFSTTHDNTATSNYDKTRKLISTSYSWGNSSDHPSVSINQDGYVGSIPRTGASTVSGPTKTTHADGSYSISTTWRGYYSGTLSKTVQVWVPNWRWVSDYTGYYSGTIYKSVRQPYVDPFRSTSDKYIVYVSDGNISELADLQDVLSKTDAQLILVGQDSIKSQASYSYFILNNKSIDQVMQDALDYIAAASPAVQKYYVLAGQDTFNLNTTNYDEENDPITEERFQYVQNPHCFDNPIGMESFAAGAYSDTTNWSDTKAGKFNTTGEFQIYRRVKDKPSTDPNFSSFSYYSGTPELIIYSQRKPIANVALSWDFDAANSVYNTTWVDNSYDPDHQYNRPDKGIVERKIMYRRNGGEWNYKIPDKLTFGSYELMYYVKDLENTWSDPFTMNFALSPAPPMQFNANLRTADSRFALSGVPASESLEAYDIWTRFPYNVYLQMALYNGSAMVSPLKTVNYSAATGEKNGNDINWNNITYQIPASLADGAYTFRITAIGDYGQTAHKDFPVTVSTPINLVGMINGATSTAEIQADSMNSFTFSTSIYATSVQLSFKGKTYTSSSGAITLTSNNGITKTWELKLNVPAATVSDGETGIATFTASTPSGKSQSVNVSYKVVTIQAYDFTVTMILDMGWRGYYFDLDNPINGDGETYGYPRKANTDIKADKMPINPDQLIPYPCTGVKAGYKVKGYIRVKGNPDSVSLIARYQQDGSTKSAYANMSYSGGDRYNFEWIIPQDTDQDSFVCFNIEIYKGGKIYGSDKWVDTWPVGNSSRAAFFVKGSVMNDILFHQSN